MKINGTIFSKPQQDQLKRGIGAELEKVAASMLNYMGDWASGNEYHENDVVTWSTDGHLYEVIKAHTSSSIIDPSNTEYYKAMTKKTYVHETFGNPSTAVKQRILDIIAKDKNAIITCVYSGGGNYLRPIGENSIGGVVRGSYNSSTSILTCPIITSTSNFAFTVIQGNSEGVTYNTNVTDIGVTGAYYLI